MRRVLPRLICSLSVITAGACGGASNIGRVVDHAPRVYRDPAGWSVTAPSGWHLVRFHDSVPGIASAGVQISNVRLPPPPINPQYPMQVYDRMLTPRGVGLIIATDTDPTLTHAPVELPPLAPPGPRWDVGSALAGSPTMELLWFRVNHRLFLADAKVGADASRAGLATLAWIIHSVRLDGQQPSVASAAGARRSPSPAWAQKCLPQGSERVGPAQGYVGLTAAAAARRDHGGNDLEFAGGGGRCSNTSDAVLRVHPIAVVYNTPHVQLTRSRIIAAARAAPGWQPATH